MITKHEILLHRRRPNAQWPPGRTIVSRAFRDNVADAFVNVGLELLLDDDPRTILRMSGDQAYDRYVYWMVQRAVMERRARVGEGAVS